MCVVSQFGLDFFSKADLKAVVNVDKLKALQQKLLQADKQNEQLAHNDALMVHGVYGVCGVYGFRRATKVSMKVTEFGLSTWGLSYETKIQRHTVEVVKDTSAR